MNQIELMRCRIARVAFVQQRVEDAERFAFISFGCGCIVSLSFERRLRDERVGGFEFEEIVARVQGRQLACDLERVRKAPLAFVERDE